MRRIPELDGLRALAAATVIGLHAATICPALRNPLLLRWGWTAVDLFFVISGYLITGIILRSWHEDGFLGRFYARRSLRIWPIYYLTLLGFAALNLAMHRPFPMDGLGYYLAYVQDVPRYWSGRMPAFCKGFAHTWSLAVEEQFYLIWPLAAGLAGRRRVVPMSIAVVGLAVGLRGWSAWGNQLLLTRCDGLALGAILAVVLGEAVGPEAVGPGRRRAFAALMVAGLGYLAAVTAFTTRRAHGDPAASPWFESVNLLAWNLTYFGLVGSVVGQSGRLSTSFLRAPWLAGLGGISYGLYLYHNPLLAVAQRLSGRPEIPAWAAGLALTMTLAAAVLSWRFVEAPALTMKSRFEGPKSPGVAVGPATIATR